MKETKRITKLFEDLYNGSPWIDVNLMEELRTLSPDEAAKRILPGCNTVWEITNHLINWRLNVLKRLRGENIVSPDNNYFAPIENTTEKAWQETLKRLSNSQDDWRHFLQDFKEDEFDKIYTGNVLTYYEHIQGIIQHDAYHLGQIVLLIKLK